MAADMFSKFKSTVDRSIAVVSVKTASSVEKSKIKTRIENFNEVAEKLTMEVGGDAYDLYIAGEADFSRLNEKFEAIREKRLEIEKLTEELDSIDERDKQVLGESAKAQAAQDSIICPGCGASFTEPVKFCRNCGTKIV